MGQQCSTCTTQDHEQEINTQDAGAQRDRQNIVNHSIDRRSPTMMKGTDKSFQGLRSSGQHGTTSPTQIHEQNLSGVIAANSHFRYDDSINQQKARNTAYQQHQHLIQQQELAAKGSQFSHNGALNFENSMRHSDQQDGHSSSYYDQPKGQQQNSNGYGHGANYSDQEEGDNMMIRPDEEQHEHAKDEDYDIEDSSQEEEEGYEEDYENCIEIDERTLIGIIKVQALIRGFLTRKMIFEHLQRMVQENQMMFQNEGMGEEAEEEEYDQELYGEEEQQRQEMGEDSEYGEEVQQNYSYQDPVQEVATEDEQTSEEEREGDGQLVESHPVHQQNIAKLNRPVNEQEEESKEEDGTSPISDRLAVSGYFRASDPGRFAPVDAVSDIQLIARRESNANQKGRTGKLKNKKAQLNHADGSDGDNIAHLQDHLESLEEGQDGSGEDSQNENGTEKRQLQHEEGEYTFENGAVYSGQWLGRFRHGFGKQTWPDGARYEGEWQNNKAHGRGVFYHVDGDVFDGEWCNDKAHGYGTYFNVNGSKYEGQWVDDLQDGEGKETWKDGSVYEGIYRQGHKHGQGRYIWADGSMYEGEWLNNKIHGVGKYVWADGREYYGTWIENKMHGSGQLIWPDGRQYEGDFINDVKEGQGTFQWPDGKIYTGQWLNGKQHGTGVLTTGGEDGVPIMGIWEKGKQVRELTKEDIENLEYYADEGMQPQEEEQFDDEDEREPCHEELESREIQFHSANLQIGNNDELLQSEQSEEQEMIENPGTGQPEYVMDLNEDEEQDDSQNQDDQQDLVDVVQEYQDQTGVDQLQLQNNEQFDFDQQNRQSETSLNNDGQDESRQSSMALSSQRESDLNAQQVSELNQSNPDKTSSP